MLGVKMPEPCQIEVSTDASKTAITEVCTECTQGQCIVHETSEKQIIVDESHKSVNQGNLFRCEQQKSSLNGVIVISDDNDTTQNVINCTDVMTDSHLAKFVTEHKLSYDVLNSQENKGCEQVSEDVKFTLDNIDNTQERTEMESDGHQVSAALERTEMESDDHQVSAAPERTEMESDDHQVSAALERTEMESDDHLVSAALERTEMDVQLVCNDLCLANMGKQLNAQCSMSFKSCKYHKRLMEIAQLLAEEASDTLELQSSGVSSSKNLEFADCLRSCGHEFSDISNHLL